MNSYYLISLFHFIVTPYRGRNEGLGSVTNLPSAPQATIWW